jgi:hypothetical protein
LLPPSNLSVARKICRSPPEAEVARWRIVERGKALRQKYVDLEKKVARYR